MKTLQQSVLFSSLDHLSLPLLSFQSSFQLFKMLGQQEPHYLPYLKFFPNINYLHIFSIISLGKIAATYRH